MNQLSTLAPRCFSPHGWSWGPALASRGRLDDFSPRSAPSAGCALGLKGLSASERFIFKPLEDTWVISEHLWGSLVDFPAENQRSTTVLGLREGSGCLGASGKQEKHSRCLLSEAPSRLLSEELRVISSPFPSCWSDYILMIYLLFILIYVYSEWCDVFASK